MSLLLVPRLPTSCCTAIVLPFYLIILSAIIVLFSCIFGSFSDYSTRKSEYFDAKLKTKTKIFLIIYAYVCWPTSFCVLHACKSWSKHIFQLAKVGAKHPLSGQNIQHWYFFQFQTYFSFVIISKIKQIWWKKYFVNKKLLDSYLKCFNFDIDIKKTSIRHQKDIKRHQ